MDVEVDPRGGRLGAQAGSPAGVGDRGGLPALRVAEEGLHQVGLPGGRLGERVGLVDVGSDAQSGHETDPTTAPGQPMSTDDHLSFMIMNVPVSKR